MAGVVGYSNLTAPQGEAFLSRLTDNSGNAGDGGFLLYDNVTSLTPHGQVSYLLDNQMHTWRIEFRDSSIALFIDGQLIIKTTDNTYTSAGQVGLRALWADINVTNFKVFAL
jgi:hypothetical protein